MHLDFQLTTRQQLRFLCSPECLEDLPVQHLPYRHVSCPNRSTVPATSKITPNNSTQQPCWLAGFHRDTISGHITSHFDWDNALHFYTTLSPEQQADYDLLVDAFQQNYTTNVHLLKARLNAAKQQPKQEIANFICTLRTLARRAYRASPYMIDQIVLTSFVEGLKSPTLRWELRKAKTQHCGRSINLSNRTRFLHCTGQDRLSRTCQPKYFQCQPNWQCNPPARHNRRTRTVLKERGG